MYIKFIINNGYTSKILLIQYISRHIKSFQNTVNTGNMVRLGGLV